MATHPVIHFLHDVGLAAWSGGSLMGAVGLNGAAAALDDPRQRAHASTAGWTRWAPVNAAAIGAHLVGGAGLLVTDWPRVRSQEGVGRSTAIKTAATGAGLCVAAWSAALNRKMAQASPVPVAGATEASAQTPPDVAKTLRQLKVVQWLNPLVSFGLIGLTAWHEEQQRATEVTAGLLKGSRTPYVAAGLAGLGLFAARRRRSSGSDTSSSTASIGTRPTPAPVSTPPSSTPSSTAPAATAPPRPTTLPPGTPPASTTTSSSSTAGLASTGGPAGTATTSGTTAPTTTTPSSTSGGPTSSTASTSPTRTGTSSTDPLGKVDLDVVEPVLDLDGKTPGTGPTRP